MKKRSNKNKTEIWYQPGHRCSGLGTGQRYRLLYQDEKGNWFATFSAYWIGSQSPYHEKAGCFSEFEKFKTKAELIRAMREYDRQESFPKAAKLGDFL